jgi:hypothetical protein
MSFQAFCDTFSIKLAKPATAEQLEKAETELGVSLAPSVRAVYEAANGGKAKPALSSLQIYSINAALKYARVPRFLEAPWSLWPLVENDDSNPICVCCQAPLTGYVVLFSHDEGPRLMFRSLENFLIAVIDNVAADEELEIAELAGDFAGPDRTKKDLTAARRLMTLAKKLQGEELTDALCFAADLWGDADVEQIKELLDFDNAAATDYLTSRLSRIPEAAGQTKAGSDKGQAKPAKESFNDFVERCGTILDAAGIEAAVVEMYGKKTIRLEPGSVWLNMPFFYEDRHRDDFEVFLLAEAKNAVKGKKRK